MDRSAEDWLAAFATALGRPAPSDADIQAVLRLASVAAHASERRAAPVACWMAALAAVDPEAAIRLAEEV